MKTMPQKGTAKKPNRPHIPEEIVETLSILKRVSSLRPKINS